MESFVVDVDASRIIESSALPRFSIDFSNQIEFYIEEKMSN